MDGGETGVIIEKGASDWQIFQQDRGGTCDIRLSGRWLTANKFKKAEVMMRIVAEDEYRPVLASLGWQPAKSAKDGKWSGVLESVPAGGLYRIETGLRLDGAPLEWITRGDMVHHVGVGDVWIVAGQSNAVGYGKTPISDPPELGVHMFRSSGEWALATHPLGDSTRTRYPANREAANASHSPFIAFARMLKRNLAYPVGIIPAALGGSPISSWLRSLDGKLFDNMLAYVRDSGGAAKGVCWYQGCTDTLTPQKDVYLKCFTEFVRETRRNLRNPSLPIITAQINRVINHAEGAPTNEAWNQIREAQRQAAAAIPGVFVVSTLDCGLSDCIHNSSAGNLVVGERMAAMALGKVYGRDARCLHPEPEKAHLLDSKSVEIIFRNVGERLSLEVVAPSAFPFEVRDKAGAVPLAGMRVEGRDRIILSLKREVQGTATVVGAPGTNPPFFVPFDVATFLPMLAFTIKVD